MLPTTPVVHPLGITPQDYPKGFTPIEQAQQQPFTSTASDIQDTGYQHTPIAPEAPGFSIPVFQTGLSEPGFETGLSDPGFQTGQQYAIVNAGTPGLPSYVPLVQQPLPRVFYPQLPSENPV